MLADDVLGLVALDALGPCVPGGDMPLRVEQEDGVIADSFNQQPKALLALAQGFLGLLSPGQVTGDFRKATKPALLVPQGRDDNVGPEPRAVLADTPALILEPFPYTALFQSELGPASVDGIGRVEA